MNLENTGMWLLPLDVSEHQACHGGKYTAARSSIKCDLIYGTSDDLNPQLMLSLLNALSTTNVLDPPRLIPLDFKLRCTSGDRVEVP